MRNVNVMKGEINQLHVDILSIRKLKVNGIGHFQPKYFVCYSGDENKERKCYFHSNKGYNINKTWYNAVND